MRLPRRRPAAAPGLPQVAPGERVLAHAGTTGGAVVAGTRDAMYLPRAAGTGEDGWVRLSWEDVESAEWDADEESLCVLAVGRWGEARPRHEVGLVHPERLLQLVRERVTASIVLTEHVKVAGRRGLRVVGRRAPAGGEVRWFLEYDEGVDPDAAQVRHAAEQALARAREQVGQ